MKQTLFGKMYVVWLVLFSFSLCAQSNRDIADSLFTTGNYVKAINTYAQVNTPGAALQIARAYNAIGNYEKASLQYEAILAKNPNQEIARFELGKLYFKIRKITEAQNLFLKLSIRNNANPEYSYYLGRIYQLKKDDSLALKSYKMAIEVDTTHLRSLFQLGKYYVAQKEKDSVLKYVNQGLQFYEDDVSLINLKALAFFNNDQYDKAIPPFERLVALKEQKPYIFQKLAYSYFRTWEFEKAKEMYEQVLVVAGEVPDALYGLGEVYLKNQERDSAEVYFKWALEAKKVSLEREYMALGRLSSAKKDGKNALFYYRLAHKENPENQITLYQICATTDQYYKDPKVKLKCYEELKGQRGDKNGYIKRFAQKRISELKEEIHLASD